MDATCAVRCFKTLLYGFLVYMYIIIKCKFTGLRFSQHCWWRLTVFWDVTLSCWGSSCHISEDQSLFIFRVKWSVLFWTTWAWRWRCCDSLKCQELFTQWHRIISLDTGLFLQGVKRTVDEIENRKIYLGELCTAHREENVHLSQAFTTFLEKQNEVSCVCL